MRDIKFFRHLEYPSPLLPPVYNVIVVLAVASEFLSEENKRCFGTKARLNASICYDELFIYLFSILSLFLKQCNTSKDVRTIEERWKEISMSVG